MNRRKLALLIAGLGLVAALCKLYSLRDDIKAAIEGWH